MRIAVVVDPHFPIPPEKYGGTERSVAYLIQGLSTLGQDITLFGPGNSQISCKIIPCSPKNIDFGFNKKLEPQFRKAKEQNIINVTEHQNEFDIISWQGSLDKDLYKIHKPIVITIRNPLDLYSIKIYKKLLKQNKNISIVALSQSYIQNYPQISFSTFIYNGLPTKTFPFTSHSKGYISFVGRFSRDKQPHIAMQAALILKKKLVVGARLDRFGEEYFKTYCSKRINNPLIEYRGELTEKEKIEVLRFSEVNLHPIFFQEPFGLSVVEAGLCGTPTIAFDKGSMKELIADGFSGFAVKNLQELIAVYPKALLLDRTKVRKHFMKFNHLTMAKKYLALFKNVVDT